MPQFADKSALGVAAVIGIITDTKMSYTQSSWLGALFYLGFIVFQLPNSYCLQKYPIGKYIGVLLIIWGAITIATAFGGNFTELAVLRVFLGLFEVGTYPDLILNFNTLYRRSEQSACFGFLYLINGVASVVGSAVAVGIANMGTVHGLMAWQWQVVTNLQDIKIHMYVKQSELCYLGNNHNCLWLSDILFF